MPAAAVQANRESAGFFFDRQQKLSPAAKQERGAQGPKSRAASALSHRLEECSTNIGSIRRSDCQELCKEPTPVRSIFLRERLRPSRVVADLPENCGRANFFPYRKNLQCRRRRRGPICLRDTLPAIGQDAPPGL